MKFDLASEEPTGPYLAKELEERVLALATQPEGLKDVRDAEQLWYGLSHTGYAWDEATLRSLISLSAQAMGDWHDNKCMHQAAICLTLTAKRRGIVLSEVEREQMTAALLAAITFGEPNDLALDAEGFVFTAQQLALHLPPAAIKRLHDGALLAMPLDKGRKHALTALANTLYDITRLGYQPTVLEAQLWQDRLLEGLGPWEGGVWDRDTLSWVFLALSACRNYSAPQELKARLRALAEGLPPDCKPGVASRILKACRRWGVRLGPGVAERLQRRYK
ncbi:hypothetical protein GPECTOR_122g461 [Gonium pectorale]|uniref:Uncharacterized protein n=1 Tax=Gonium pectorale TaxID=33097 RepID=A0A150G075_GONPE|nr:hypothetical protein GPECTOR_122g461 [Gonium pectorale]|eukprot:KXZ42720.1 hypothetical protein GPECTOR_122g461 [Gonium pectorale]